MKSSAIGKAAFDQEQKTEKLAHEKLKNQKTIKTVEFRTCIYNMMISHWADGNTFRRFTENIDNLDGGVTVPLFNKPNVLTEYVSWFPEVLLKFWISSFKFVLDR